jgi:integrase
MPAIGLDTLTSTNVTTFFKVLNDRKRIVGKGIIKTGVKKSTVANYWGKLNNFFKWLKAREYIHANPLNDIKYPSPVYENKKYLRREEIEKILTAILNHSDKNILVLKRNLVIFYLLLFTGLRREELLFLQIRDIDIERRILQVRADTSKSGRDRTLPLHSHTIMYLKDYLKERKNLTTPYLLVSSLRDDRLSYDGLKHLVVRIVRRSGVKFHLHQFRHTFAINFLKSSNNIAKLKQLMGHKDIRMTMLYLRCIPTQEMRRDIEHMSIDTLI